MCKRKTQWKIAGKMWTRKFGEKSVDRKEKSPAHKCLWDFAFYSSRPIYPPDAKQSKNQCVNAKPSEKSHEKCKHANSVKKCVSKNWHAEALQVKRSTSEAGEFWLRAFFVRSCKYTTLMRFLPQLFIYKISSCLGFEKFVLLHISPYGVTM